MGLQISQGMPFCECIVKKTLENTEGAIKNEQPRDNGNIHFVYLNLFVFVVRHHFGTISAMAVA
jgi:hypothetical protein